MADICTDNRLELIQKYKKKLLDATNIEDSPDEMKAIDDVLFRFWQMGWLDRLETDAVSIQTTIDKYCEKFCYYTKTYFGRFKDVDEAIEHLERKCENCPLKEV